MVMLLVLNMQQISPHLETPYHTPFEVLVGHIKGGSGLDLMYGP